MGWAGRWHDEGAAVGGAFTGTVWAAQAGMLAQAPAPAWTDVTMTGVALAVSRRPRR
jgi:transcriptional regulator GlxA family with amidase domain